jgi:hypothetical protein
MDDLYSNNLRFHWTTGDFDGKLVFYLNVCRFRYVDWGWLGIWPGCIQWNWDKMVGFKMI